MVGECAKIVIIFASEKPRRQLLEHNLVATLRKKQHKVGMDWATDARGHPKLADVAISFERHVINSRDLEPYVADSGFASLKEWVTEYFRLNPKLMDVTGYLYIVALFSGRASSAIRQGKSMGHR
jgi:hypothetical protein